MKKRIIAAVLAGIMAMGLAACSSGAEGSSASADATAADTTAEAAASDAAGAADGAVSTSAWEPSTTVSIVVPAGAGGNTDLSARVFAQYAKQLTGHDFIVVNANGAAGSVAANQVLDSDNDGHTVLYGHNLVNVANIAGVTDYNYTAFVAGPNFAKDPAQQLYVNADKYSGLDDFIEAAKAAPGELKACTEVGAYTYYELLAFEQAAGIDLDLVDVGSNSDKIAAMLSGQVDLMPGSYVNCMDYLETGQFVCLGEPTEERFSIFDDIPTMKEQGVDLVYPDCDFSFYFPAGTSDDVVTYYEDLVQAILADADAQEAIAGLQMEPYYMSAADSAANDEEIYNTIKEIADSLQ